MEQTIACCQVGDGVGMGEHGKFSCPLAQLWPFVKGVGDGEAVAYGSR